MTAPADDAGRVVLSEAEEALAVADELARVLCDLDGKVWWTDDIPAKYRDTARGVMASKVWARRLATEAARADAAEAALGRVRAVADLWDSCGGCTVYQSWGRLAARIRAALDGAKSPI